MFFLVQDPLSAWRILLHIWMNRMHNTALQIFPNTFTVSKIPKSFCFLKVKKQLNQNRLIEPPVLREQGTLTAGALPMQAELSHHCLGHGNITPSRSSHSSAPALHPPQGRTEAAAALSAGSLLSPTAPAPPALLSLPQPWLWGPHTRTIRLSSAPQYRQGWATAMKPQAQPSHFCTLWTCKTFHFQTTPT